MSTETRFRLAAPEVISELLDDEVMLIHLSRGIYFSLSGSGVLLHPSLADGASADELAAELAAQTDADPATSAAAARRLLAELMAHGLVVSSSTTTASLTATTRASVGDTGARRAFVEPRLEAFTELQDLLLADPVHDVDPSGWPNVKGSTQGSP